MNVNDDWTQASQAHASGDFPRAFACCTRLLDVEPRHVGAWQLMATMALSLKQFQEAVVLYTQALQLRADEASLWVNRGTAHHEWGDHAAALADYEQALVLQPDEPEAWYNRANALKALGRWEEAAKAYAECLKRCPDHAQAHFNWGNLLFEQGQDGQAVQHFDQALALRPQDAEIRKNRAFAQLMQGQFPKGWGDYEARWLTEPLKSAHVSRDCPEWDGVQSLQGRCILVHAEQGLGDTLQFCRFAAAVKARGAALVVLEVQRPLVPLLQGLKGADLVVPPGLASFTPDVQVPLMSLPRVLGLGPEAWWPSQPYLRADPTRVAQWASRLPPQGLRVGICWEGSVKGIEAGRHIPLAAFEPLAQVPGVHLVSLQKGAADLASPSWPLQCFGTALDREAPFLDTAALMAALDLVITTDTSVAHLAGGLGVPVWVALSHHADWRWMRHKTDTPWYPTMRLFRQPRRGDWPGCFASIRCALLEQAG